MCTGRDSPRAKTRESLWSVLDFTRPHTWQVWDFNEPVTLSAAARCSATLEGDMPAEAHWPIAPGGAELPYRLAVELAWPPGEVVSSDVWTRSDDGSARASGQRGKRLGSSK